VTVADIAGSPAAISANSALAAVDVHKSFGGAKAVNGATFSVPTGCITALIGPNGAGKTTVVNILSGALSGDSGQVTMGELDVTGLPSFQRARLGLIRTFQLSRELGGLTVFENLMVAAKVQPGESLTNVYFRPGLVKQAEKENRARAASVLELIDRIGEHIRDLKNAGVTVLMVEHNLAVVEEICDHIIVLAEGRTLATGLMSELRDNADVVRAYLGGVLDGRVDR